MTTHPLPPAHPARDAGDGAAYSRPNTYSETRDIRDDLSETRDDRDKLSDTRDIRDKLVETRDDLTGTREIMSTVGRLSAA